MPSLKTALVYDWLRAGKTRYLLYRKLKFTVRCEDCPTDRFGCFGIPDFFQKSADLEMMRHKLGDVPMKFKEVNPTAESLWLVRISKKPWFLWFGKIFILPLIWLFSPLIDWKAPYLHWESRVARLAKKGRDEEAFLLGFEILSSWNNGKNKPDWPPFVGGWYLTFKSLCGSGLKISRTDVLEKIESLFIGRPSGTDGYMAADMLREMAGLSWLKGDAEKAWLWADQSARTDESYGWSFYLRAWIGKRMGVGQPVTDLISAVLNEPELESEILNDDYFRSEEGFLEGFKEELKKWR